jgi:hypothetical protein
MRCRFWLAIVIVCAAARAFAGAPKDCMTAEEAAKNPNKDVCITAHVYDVVELSDGTRYLDVCAPQTPDDSCHFTIVSLREDRREVGDLLRYRNTNVRIRGIVQPMRGRVGLLLSHAQQFYGGPPKFRPNPKLLHGFDAEHNRRPVSDPNMHSKGTHRSFMEPHDRTSRRAK